jgi:uncharacterized membrane protein YeaQ/YmgE (transglycosylase-associated protein family)
MFNGFIIMGTICALLMGKFHVSGFFQFYLLPLVAGIIGAMIAFLTYRNHTK